MPKWLIPVLALVLVIALVGAGLVFLDKDNEAGAGEIFLEPAASAGNDPFSTTNYATEAPTTTARATTTTTTARPTTTGATQAVRSVSGDQVGLYGGTTNQSYCDVEQMSAFLQANPSQAGAFVAALNSDPTLRWSGGTQVTVAQLPAYLDELTPVTLTRDTRVTNHGYRNGRPTPLQSVLQAGTAVLIDRYGVPRSRCACGNPLIPPQRITTTPRYTGPRWPTFSPTTVIVVTEVNVEINTFVLVDLNTGDLFDRPAGTTGEEDEPTEPPTTEPPATEPPDTEPPATEPPETEPPATEPPPTQPPPTQPPGTAAPLGTGDVQVTLTWTGDVDLDLHVIDPSGTEIYFASPTSPSGGQLDVDYIPTAGDSGTHVENIYWPTGGAPAGSYQALVEGLGGYNDSSANFTMDVIVNGARVAGTGGVIDGYGTSETVTFSF